MKKMIRTVLLVSLGIPFSPEAFAATCTVFVDPTVSGTGSGTQASPYKSWNSVTMSAGKTYCQKAGTTFTGTINDAAQATSSSPIVITSYNSGAAPVVVGTFNFTGAAYATLTGFTVEKGTYSPVVIQNSSRNITISGNTLTGSSSAGVNISGAGGNLVISGNTITNNASFGISVYQVANTTATESSIFSNVIQNNAGHGIEIKGNYFNVYGNTITSNGLSMPGSSGIHVYSGGYNGDPFTAYGAYNTIQNNIISLTVEPSATDGNGIELDQQTHGNQVIGNVCFENAGAGIIAYDSYGNTIQNNFTMNNSLGNTSTRTIFPELSLSSSTTYDDTYGNTVTGNTFVATSSRGVAVFVDPGTSKHSNTMQGNFLANSASSNTWNYAYDIGKTATWNSVKWSGSSADTVQSGTPESIGAIPMLTQWKSNYSSELTSLGYSVNWD